MRRIERFAFLVALAACSHTGSTPGDDDGVDGGTAWQAPLGATWTPDGSEVVFRLGSTRATRIELLIFDAPTQASELVRLELSREDAEVWRATVPAAGLPATIYYGYRVWGPNWPYDPAWVPGSEAGWIADVDVLMRTDH